jgi:hypothetical protein
MVIEVTKELAVIWTILAGLFFAGISWGVVWWSQRSFERRMDEVTKWMRDMEKRQNADQQRYVTQTQCERERTDCNKNLSYHEGQLLEKLNELKIYMVAMDKKREDTRKELTTQFNIISTELAVLKRSVEHGPIRGA